MEMSDGQRGRLGQRLRWIESILRWDASDRSRKRDRGRNLSNIDGAPEWPMNGWKDSGEGPCEPRRWVYTSYGPCVDQSLVNKTEVSKVLQIFISKVCDLLIVESVLILEFFRKTIFWKHLIRRYNMDLLQSFGNI